MLQLKNLSLIIDGKQIIRNLNVDFWDNHIHAVVGPNGAGKSTLASTIMGLVNYHQIKGDILWNGESIRNDSIDQRAKKGISLAWQEPARYEGLTVGQFLMASSKNKKQSTVEDVLQRVSLDPEKYSKRKLDASLSGGERKKIELASILAMRPSFVMLDEPDSGIDIISIEKIFEATRILKEQGATVLLITHSLEVLKQAEHAFVMCCGEIHEKGTVEEILPYFENQCLICNHQNIPAEDAKEAELNG